MNIRNGWPHGFSICPLIMSFAFVLNFSCFYVDAIAQEKNPDLIGAKKGVKYQNGILEPKKVSNHFKVLDTNGTAGCFEFGLARKGSIDTREKF